MKRDYDYEKFVKLYYPRRNFIDRRHIYIDKRSYREDLKKIFISKTEIKRKGQI